MVISAEGKSLKRKFIFGCRRTSIANLVLFLLQQHLFICKQIETVYFRLFKISRYIRERIQVRCNSVAQVWLGQIQCKKNIKQAEQSPFVKQLQLLEANFYRIHLNLTLKCKLGQTLQIHDKCKSITIERRQLEDGRDLARTQSNTNNLALKK